MTDLSPLPPNQHPMYNPLTMGFATPMVSALLQTVTDWVWMGTTGAYIVGDSQIGKTKATQLIASRIRDRAGRAVPCQFYSTPCRDKRTIREVFESLCNQAQFLFRSRATTNELANQIINRFAEIARYQQSDRIVLFVDEMQRL